MVTLQASPPWVKRTQTSATRASSSAQSSTWWNMGTLSWRGFPWVGGDARPRGRRVGGLVLGRGPRAQMHQPQRSEQRGRLSCCLVRSSCHSHSHQPDSSRCEGLPLPLAPSPPPWGWGCPLPAALGEGQTFSTHN